MAHDVNSIIEVQDTASLYDALGHSTRLKVLLTLTRYRELRCARSIVVSTTLCITWLLVQQVGACTVFVTRTSPICE